MLRRDADAKGDSLRPKNVSALLAALYRLDHCGLSMPTAGRRGGQSHMSPHRGKLWKSIPGARSFTPSPTFAHSPIHNRADGKRDLHEMKCTGSGKARGGGTYLRLGYDQRS